VGRQIGEQQPDHAESREHPAVASILALAGTEISAAEQRDAREHEAHDHKRGQRRVGEEGRKGAPAEDREPEIGQRRDPGDECYSRRRHHGINSSARTSRGSSANAVTGAANEPERSRKSRSLSLDITATYGKKHLITGSYAA